MAALKQHGDRCKSGVHILTPENSYWQRSGSGDLYLRCRACHRAAAKAYRAKLKAERVAA